MTSIQIQVLQDRADAIAYAWQRHQPGGEEYSEEARQAAKLALAALNHEAVQYRRSFKIVLEGINELECGTRFYFYSAICQTW